MYGVHSAGVNIAAESYGRDSRCFEHYSPFVMTLNESHTQQSLQGAGCYQVSVRLVGEGWGCELLLLQFLCTSRRVVVVVGKQRLRCSPSAEGNRVCGLCFNCESSALVFIV